MVGGNYEEAMSRFEALCEYLSKVLKVERTL